MPTAIVVCDHCGKRRVYAESPLTADNDRLRAALEAIRRLADSADWSRPLGRLDQIAELVDAALEDRT